MIMLFNDSDILVETEDGTSQQKRLGDVIEQSSCDVIYLDYLISHECNAAHNEQHGTGVLRDFEALFLLLTSYFLHQTSYIRPLTSSLPRLLHRGVLR